MDFRQKVFEIRSYLPIPFFLIAVIYANPNPATLSIGFLIALVGESIRFWGVSICGSETRTTGNVGASHLVTDGPFGYVRNPLYVGNILMYSGCVVMSNAFYPNFLIIAILFFIIEYQLIVSREEEFLENYFKDEYATYKINVPRFIPRLTKYVGTHSFHRAADFSRGLKSEMRTLQAFILITTILLLRFFEIL